MRSTEQNQTNKTEKDEAAASSSFLSFITYLSSWWIEGSELVKNEYRLSASQKKEMVASIQRYYMEERQEELGELAAGLLLDFFIKELAAVFYNKGLEDAYTFYTSKLEEVFEIQK